MDPVPIAALPSPPPLLPLVSSPSPPLLLAAQVDDGRVVGTPLILGSSRVTAAVSASSSTSRSVTTTSPASSSGGSARPGPAISIPTPSVFVDIRGEIHNVRVGNLYEDEVQRQRRRHNTADDKNPNKRRPDPASSTTTTTASTSLQQTRYNILYTKAGVMRSGDLHQNVQHDFVFEGLVRVWQLQTDGSTTCHTYGPHSYVTIPPYTPHIFEFVQDTVLAEWWDGNDFVAWYYQPYRDVVVQRSVPPATADTSAVGATVPSGRLLQYSIQRRNTPFLLSWKFLVGVATGFSIGAWVRRR